MRTRRAANALLGKALQNAALLAVMLSSAALAQLLQMVLKVLKRGYLLIHGLHMLFQQFHNPSAFFLRLLSKGKQGLDFGQFYTVLAAMHNKSQLFLIGWAVLPVIALCPLGGTQQAFFFIIPNCHNLAARFFSQFAYFHIFPFFKKVLDPIVTIDIRLVKTAIAKHIHHCMEKNYV